MLFRVVILTLLVSQVSLSQTVRVDSIYKKGHHYYQNEVELTESNLGSLLTKNGHSFTEYQAAISDRTKARVIGGIGGISLVVGTIQAMNHSRYEYLILGSVCSVYGIVKTTKSHQHLKKAIRAYNLN